MKVILSALLLVLLPLAGLANSLDGRWIGNRGEVVVSGNQWAYYIGGSLDDAGMLGYNGRVIQTQSQFTGAVTNYLYLLEDQSLTLQDPTGMLHHYTRRSESVGGDPGKCDIACFEARYGAIMPNVPGD